MQRTKLGKMALYTLILTGFYNAKRSKVKSILTYDPDSKKMKTN